jgi:hypothetical protein
LDFALLGNLRDEVGFGHGFLVSFQEVSLHSLGL